MSTHGMEAEFGDVYVSFILETLKPLIDGPVPDFARCPQHRDHRVVAGGWI
ncbi:MAG: hypothetical protein U0163_13840 [Gemmatimonadaceae bacterium]